jgi:glycine/D-amino acid oxidase-like deaminating enzyme
MNAGLTQLWDRMLNVRRQVYQRVLYEGAVEQGVKVRFGCRVAKIDDSEKGPSVTLSTGETLSADFIVGADGLSHPFFPFNHSLTPFPKESNPQLAPSSSAERISNCN